MTIAAERQIEADVRREIAKLKPPDPLVHRRGPKCRVCQEETSRVLVNKMLAHAVTSAEIFQVADMMINPHRAKNAKVTYSAIRYHAIHHFTLDQPAQAAYRRMLERRQAETAHQFMDGVTRLITAMGYLDVVVQKGYETLVKDETYVSAELGMEAAIKLHAMTQKAAGAQEIAELKQQLNLALSAVKDVVPEQYWAEIVARLEDAEVKAGTHVVDAEVIDDYDDDSEEPYAPPVEGDIDDTLEG